MSKAIEQITLPNGREVAVHDTDLYNLNKALDVLTEEYLRTRTLARAERAKLQPQIKKLEAAQKAKDGTLWNKNIGAILNRPDYRKPWERWNALSYALHALAKQIAGEKPQHPVHHAIQAKAAHLNAALYAEGIPAEMAAAVANICRTAGIKPIPKEIDRRWSLD